MQKHGSKYFFRYPPPPNNRGCQKFKINFFSEHRLVAYQNKGNHGCKNMAANSLPTDTPLTKGVGSIGQNSTFPENGHVAYQIEWNHQCSSMVANILLQTRTCSILVANDLSAHSPLPPRT